MSSCSWIRSPPALLRRRGRLAVAISMWLAVVAAGCASSESSSPVPRQTTPAVSLPHAPELGAGKSPNAGRSADGAHPAQDEPRIARMLKKVSAARKLAPKQPVPGKTLDRTALLERVKEHVAREVPKDAIHNEGLAMKLLGLVPPDFDYEKETYALLQAQLAGYYEPADRTMYMAADLDEDNARATLAHELVHALQDQYWDLSTRSKYKRGQGDLSSTLSALAEGDATSAMFDVLLSGTGRSAIDLPEEIFTEQIIQSVSQGPSARAPHAMRAALVAPYVHGTLFVHALRRKGGWELVNRAWERPPVSTEQVLHPEKWEASEAPISVTPPSFAALGPSFRSADVDTFGELGLRLTFGEWMDESSAELAALDWGGDRATLVTSGDEAALGWRIAYDLRAPGSKKGKSPAERAFSAIASSLDARVGRAAKRDANFVCFGRGAIGPLGVMRKGDTLVVVAGPAKTSDRGVWSDAGTCTKSEKWASEIAGQ